MPTSDSDTCDLVRRAASGEEGAIEDLMRRHRKRLKEMVRLRMDPRLVYRVDPSDVIQESLTKAWQRLPEYLEKQPIPFYPWLRRIAWQELLRVHEQHLDAQKRSVRRERRGRNRSDHSSRQIAAVIADGMSSPSVLVSKKEIIDRMRLALGQLSHADREVLLQRYVEQLSVQEIAEGLETTEAAVYKRHARALEKVHRFLSGVHDGS